jgi:hypothetical protein
VARVIVFLSLAAIVASTSTAGLGRTFAYFTSSATAADSSMTTAQLLLDVSTAPSASRVFNIAANMLPGDFDLQTIDIVNNGTAGVPQLDFTYSLASSSVGTCSRLDSSNPPTCTSPALPSAAADTGAALLLLRCTSNSAATTPVACDTQNVYLTQVYPAAGAGTQRQITTVGGLVRGAVTGVAGGGSYAINIGGTNFSGGPLLITSPVGLGGPNSVTGADSQLTGLLANRTDHLASVVYLPTQAGASLADQTSVLTFTWTVTQRLGGPRS